LTTEMTERPDSYDGKKAGIGSRPLRKTLATHRAALRQLVSRYNVAYPRVYGSVLTGNDAEESDLDYAQQDDSRLL
jgi:hypothetical protein